nr:hypothetical protein [Tanacetum cinerariifolium]
INEVHDYWSRIDFDGDFLGLVPFYTSLSNSLRRLCHRLIAFNIFRRGQTPEKVTTVDLIYTRSMDEGMVGLTVVVCDLTVIAMDELARLRICERIRDTWAWVALRPERQQVAAVRAAQADQEIPKEGV